MKNIAAFLVFFLFGLTASAQYYYQDSNNYEMLRHSLRHEPCKKEIILPVVNGYNVYKADLHTHTIFSDGFVHPLFRVQEAWYDGLDVMAVTEHMEYRSHEKELVDYLKKYVNDRYKGAVNEIIMENAPTEDGIMVDLNYCVRESQKIAEQYGITIIPGSEITRDGTTVGHYNALFTTDNNLLYNPDPVQAIRNAKAQGALVMHNHPGWRKENLNFTETDKAAYGEGLIDGVEVMNGPEFYPAIIDRALERGLFMAANSDIHRTTATDYKLTGAMRTMTFIFAKDKSLSSIREALQEQRTLAFGYNTICGAEQLLKDFFLAGVRTEVMMTDSKGVSTVMLTNTTSLPYLIKLGQSNPVCLDPFSTISLKSSAGSKELKVEILNMFCLKDTHPVVDIAF